MTTWKASDESVCGYKGGRVCVCVCVLMMKYLIHRQIKVLKLILTPLGAPFATVHNKLFDYTLPCF